MSLRREIHLFSGFRQDESIPTGTFRLWSALHQEFAGPDTIVEMHPWDTNPRVLAQRIANSSYGRHVDVVLGGYSFGGMTAALVAGQLGACGISVRQLVLTDAVYRHWYYAGWWRSLMPWAEIEIPRNVGEVVWFVQKNPRFKIGRMGGWVQPAGHQLVAENPLLTKIRKPVWLTRDHSAMDEAPQYRDALLEACRCVVLA